VAVGAWAIGADPLPEETPTTAVPPTIAPTSTTASPTTTSEQIPAEHPYGGDATIGIPTEPITVNPFLDGGGAEVVQLIGRTAWAGGITLDGLTLDPVPVLLSEIPTLDNGGLVEKEDGTVTVTYRIDPDATWEDGSPVTGADFEFTFRLVTDPALPIRADVRAPYTVIVPESMQATDSTVTFDLASPSLAYLDVFSIVVPAAQVGESDFLTDWNDRLWMSAGPFRFSEWIPGESISMERNDEYWESDPETGQLLPYLDRLIFEVAAGPEEVAAGLQAAVFDVVTLPPDPTVLSELEEIAAVDVQVGRGPTWEHLTFQFGSGRFARNPDSRNQYLDYRRAVAHAIDRGSIASVVSGGRVEALDSPLGVVWPAAASVGWSQYGGDVNLAKDALDELRATVDVSIPQAVLTINNTPERNIAAEELGPLLAAGGIALKIESPEQTGVYFLETIGPGQFDLAEWAWVPTPGPSGAVADIRRWFLLTPEAGGSNFSRWPASAEEPADEIARLTSLLEEVAVEVDLEQVKAMLSEIETLMADLVTTLPLYAELNAGAVWIDAVSGYRHSIIPGGDTWNVATWYRTDG
jgi:peptide/nickel transport system substrate-binding protein